LERGNTGEGGFMERGEMGIQEREGYGIMNSCVIYNFNT